MVVVGAPLNDACLCLFWMKADGKKSKVEEERERDKVKSMYRVAVYPLDCNGSSDQEAFLCEVSMFTPCLWGFPSTVQVLQCRTSVCWGRLHPCATLNRMNGLDVNNLDGWMFTSGNFRQMVVLSLYIFWQLLASDSTRFPLVSQTFWVWDNPVQVMEDWWRETT